jgi:hypothetical protein
LLSDHTGKLIAHGTAIMQRPEYIAQALDCVGVVHRVDTVNRELTVFVNDELLTFDVPIGCPVILHGEPVKLRMVQPQDRVKIAHASRGSLCVALTIEVQPDEIAGRAVRGLSGHRERNTSPAMGH